MGPQDDTHMANTPNTTRYRKPAFADAGIADPPYVPARPRPTTEALPSMGAMAPLSHRMVRDNGNAQSMVIMYTSATIDVATSAPMAFPRAGNQPAATDGGVSATANTRLITADASNRKAPIAAAFG